MFKVVERAKWDAWNSVKNLSKEEAMTAYVDEIKNVNFSFFFKYFLMMFIFHQNKKNSDN
jgi:hypothetical protein